MLISDIEKEGFIKFEEEDKSKEISKDDYYKAIKNAYISQLKYRNGKVDPQLKAKYKEIKNRMKKVNNMINIDFIISKITKL